VVLLHEKKRNIYGEHGSECVDLLKRDRLSETGAVHLTLQICAGWRAPGWATGRPRAIQRWQIHGKERGFLDGTGSACRYRGWRSIRLYWPDAYQTAASPRIFEFGAHLACRRGNLPDSAAQPLFTEAATTLKNCAPSSTFHWPIRLVNARCTLGDRMTATAKRIPTENPSQPGCAFRSLRPAPRLMVPCRTQTAPDLAAEVIHVRPRYGPCRPRSAGRAAAQLCDNMPLAPTQATIIGLRTADWFSATAACRQSLLETAGESSAAG